MAKTKRKRQEALTAIEDREYSLGEAIGLLKKVAYAKFDESLDIVMNLGVDPRHADQMVRGSVVLPHGLGKETRVLVVASGEKIKEAQDAGADHVGSEDVVQKIQGGWMEFDTVISTPDMMKEVGKLGRVLGPRGLMPNPKSGTVTFDVAEAVKQAKAGKVDYRVDKNGVIHAPAGRRSFEESALEDNTRALVGSVYKAKPAAAKGKYVKSAYISFTMSPSVKLNLSDLESGGAA